MLSLFPTDMLQVAPGTHSLKEAQLNSLELTHIKGQLNILVVTFFCLRWSEDICYYNKFQFLEHLTIPTTSYWAS